MKTLTMREHITAQVVDVIRYLAAYTATGELTDVSKARNGIRSLANHEVCGGGDTSDHYCMEIALPLWDVCLYIQRNFQNSLDGGEE